MRMQHQASLERERTATSRFAILDLLRFIAAIAVMFYHYLYTARVESVYPLASRLALHGYLGVELFFIISGFVVVWSAQGRSALRFAKARIVRLYPEYWVALSVSVLVFSLVRQAHFLELSAIDI